MPQPEPRAWWADVEHLRDRIERRREKELLRTRRLEARAAREQRAEREQRARLRERAAVGTIPARSWVDDEAFDGLRYDDDRLRGGRFDDPGFQDPRFHDPTFDLADWVSTPQRRFVRAERAESAEEDAPPRQAAPPRRRPGPSVAPAAVAPPSPLAVPSRRRTVEITGRTVGAPSLPRLVQIDRRRPARRPVERVGPRPDRIALWAVVLAFFLILVAVTSASHAAVRPTGSGAQRAHAAKVQRASSHTAQPARLLAHRAS